MGNSQMGEITYSYCKKYPETPSLTLAKKLYKEHPQTFLSIEHARSRVRYHRGQSGDLHRKYLLNRDTMKEAGAYNPFELPESDAKPRIPVTLEGDRFLMLYDIHMPYHDKQALETSIKYGIERNCNTVYLGGDNLDFHQISHFIREPDARNIAGELKMFKNFLGYLRGKFPKALIYFKEGNHEERWWKYMRVKAVELVDIKAISVPHLLDFDKFGIRWLHGKTKSNIGKLSIFHGHEFTKTSFSPVNVARGLYLRAKASSMCGHSHQSSEHTEADVNGKIVTCWSVGCLSELSPEYSPYNKWNHGFAFIERDSEEFHVDNKRIGKGKIL